MDTYEIRVAGHVSQRRGDALGCQRLQFLPEGESLLTFEAVDQAALYGLLSRLRDAGLELLAAERVAMAAGSDRGAATVSASTEGPDVIA